LKLKEFLCLPVFIFLNITIFNFWKEISSFKFIQIIFSKKKIKKMKFFIRNYKISEETIDKKIKKASFEILSNSSLAFLLSPIRSKRILIKFIWIIFIFSFLIESINCVLLNILNYLSFDITTSIYEVNEHRSQFPTLSFCSNEEPIKIESIKLKKLRFNYQEINSDWKNHVEIYLDTTYGKCFRFNSGLNLTNQSIPIKYSKKSRLNDGF